MTAVLVALCAAVGLAVGPVLNAAIRRVPDKVPVLQGGVSYAPTERRDVVVDVSAAVLFALAAAKFGWSWALPAYLLFFASLLVVSVIDLDHFRIPNRI